MWIRHVCTGSVPGYLWGGVTGGGFGPVQFQMGFLAVTGSNGFAGNYYNVVIYTDTNGAAAAPSTITGLALAASTTLPLLVALGT